jgi:hypothetical protein
MNRRIVPITAALAAGILTASAETPIDQARQGGARQSEIQQESKELASQLENMLDEYSRNGLGGDDSATIRSLRDVMGRVSQKDMERIRELLQQGGNNRDAQSALKAIADAYSAQKGVLLQLKRVLADHERSKEALELSHQATELADRQAAALQTAIGAAQWALADAKNQGNVQGLIEAQKAEQKAIADELKLLEKKIGAFAKDPQNKGMADRFARGIEETGKVAPVLDSAVKAMEENRLFEAVTAQKTARDQMRQLARTIAPPKDDVETLRQAVQQTERMLAQQKELQTAVERAYVPPFEKWIADGLKDPKSRLARDLKSMKLAGKTAAELAAHAGVKNLHNILSKAANEALAGLESRQGDVANQVESISQEIAKTAAPAAQSLQNALAPMQDARAEMVSRNAEAAAKPVNDAVAAMEKAKADLENRLALAERAEEAAGDPVARLQDLQKKARDLMAEQAAETQKNAQPGAPGQAVPDAAKQAELAQKAQDLQNKAAPDAPAAADALAKAAANMQQAAGAMNKPGNPAAAQQQAAMQNLAKAEQQLGQKLAQAQAAQAAIAQAEKALSELAKIIEAQQKLQIDTALAAAKPSMPKSEIIAYAPREEAIRRDTETLSKAPAPAAPVQVPAPGIPSGAALARAVGFMGQARIFLEKADAALANPEEQKALKELYAVQDSLQAQLQAAQEQLGAEAAAQAEAAQAEAAAAAAEALAQAQTKTGEAQNAMEQAQAAPEAAAAPQNPQAANAPQEGAQAPAPATPPTPPGQQAAAPRPPQPGAPGNANQQAAGKLEQAAEAVAAASADSRGLSKEAQGAMRNALEALAAAAAKAAANQTAPAQADAQKAQNALAQAQAALSQAQAGVASTPAQGEQGADSTGGAPGGTKPGQGNSPAGGTASTIAGAPTIGKGGFLGLPERERATIVQAQSEKYPQQYGAEVEQYLRNLADESSAR